MFNLLPKDPAFYDRLQQFSERLVHAAQNLTVVVESWPDFNGRVDAMERERHQSHGILREILLTLDEAFITPFDREDILQLATEMYSVIESITSAAQRLRIYQLRELYPSLHAQVKTLESCTGAVHAVIEEMPHNRTLEHLRSRLEEIGRLEDHGRAEHFRFLAELFRGSPDPLEVMKKREVEELIVQAIRACDTLGRTIERVLLKND